MENNKYYFICRNCGNKIEGFGQWFYDGQKCPACGGKWVDAKYTNDYLKLPDLINNRAGHPDSLFHYFDYLPLHDRNNIVTEGEGVIPVDRWKFLEEFALKYYGLDLTVLAYRNDKNPGTGTFKDVAAAVVASVLKENGIKEYCVASTGNIASAFAHYLALAGISLSVFIPDDALKANEAGVGCYGQRVFRVRGDYSLAKKLCAEFSKKHNINMSGGNIDPARVEAKKTQVFEWLRQLGYIPDVYIQALAGGTGPIAIHKGLEDIRHLKLFKKEPRYMLIQASGCNPMTMAWEQAKLEGFTEGWKNRFPILNHPETCIPTLANGNPQTYPILAQLVQSTGGEFLTFDENLHVSVARLISFESSVLIGPAAAIAVGGFFEALKTGAVRNGERVMINIGEGIQRAPELFEKMIFTTERVSSVDECLPSNRNNYREQLYHPFLP
ncbi:MAG: pyridoxal-phosphate dependent enzyme [Porphyromonadaceae bacterium]|nr:MAG: pyridoxal-phosphate dependent enzyme [Porphyromonadaceae bacterium]